MSFKPVCLAIFGLLLSGLIGCRPPVPEDPFTGLQGEWEVASLQHEGQTTGADALKRLSISIRKDRFQMLEKKASALQPGGQTFDISIAEEYVLQVDPSKNPAEMQLVYPMGDKQGQLRRAIYAIEATQLNICAAEVGKPAPTEFAVDDKPGWSLYVLRRRE